MQLKTKKPNEESGSGSEGPWPFFFFFAVSLVPDILSGGRAVTRLATAHTCTRLAGWRPRQGGWVIQAPLTITIFIYEAVLWLWRVSQPALPLLTRQSRGQMILIPRLPEEEKEEGWERYELLRGCDEGKTTAEKIDGSSTLNVISGFGVG